MDDISAELGKSRCHPQSLIWLLPSFAAAGLFIFPPFTPRLLSLFLSLSLHHTPSPLSIRGQTPMGRDRSYHQEKGAANPFFAQTTKTSHSAILIAGTMG